MQEVLTKGPWVRHEGSSPVGLWQSLLIALDTWSCWLTTFPYTDICDSVMQTGNPVDTFCRRLGSVLVVERCVISVCVSVVNVWDLRTLARVKTETHRFGCRICLRRQAENSFRRSCGCGTLCSNCALQELIHQRQICKGFVFLEMLRMTLNIFTVWSLVARRSWNVCVSQQTFVLFTDPNKLLSSLQILINFCSVSIS